MNRRGLTLLEVLLALSLLATLCSLLTAWLITTSRLSMEQAPRLQWTHAAQATLDLIEDDLATGDFETQPRARAAANKFEIRGESELRIITRDRLALNSEGAIHDYVWESERQRLVLRIRARDDSSPVVERVLLIGVANWRITTDPERRTLTIGLESAAGPIATRSMRWP